jgi:aspartate racemase
MKTLGILGGLGPESTTEFYLQLVKKCREQNNISWPPVAVYCVPLAFDFLNEVIIGGGGEIKDFLPFLIDGAKQLDKADPDFAVIPCNTAHIFIDEIRAAVKTPYLSIVEEIALLAQEKRMKTLGLLGTQKTIDSGIYEKAFQKQGISLVIPSQAEQEIVSQTIGKILNNTTNEEDKIEMLNIVRNLQQKGAKAVILGCTDIQLLINQKDTDVILIDTVETLVDATVKKMLS